MKGILVECVMFLYVLSFTVSVKRNKFDEAWSKYIKEFHKHYDHVEAAMRRKLWEENKRMVDKHNKGYNEGRYTYSMHMNHMSDWTKEEKKSFFPCVMPKQYGEDYLDENSAGISDGSNDDQPEYYVIDCDKRCQRKLPKNVDYRKKKVITPVKDQEQCKSCYAFGTVAAIEAHHALSTGKLVSLSEQQILDCAHEGNIHGCSGGDPNYAYRFAFRNWGLNTEKDYPYKAKNGTCRKNPYKIQIDSFRALKPYDENNMKAVVALRGPITASVVFNENKITNYFSGFLTHAECKPGTMNHAIAIVGYGVKNSTPYWLIKNSWSKKWGIDGYGMIKRDGTNHCGIAAATYLPEVYRKPMLINND